MGLYRSASIRQINHTLHFVCPINSRPQPYSDVLVGIEAPAAGVKIQWQKNELLLFRLSAKKY